jgi:uncharacterized membrane protein
VNARGLKIALVASVVLNLFLIGAGVSGAVMVRHALKERALLREGTPLFTAARTLDPELQRKLRADMQASALQAVPDFNAAREARRRAARLAAAPTFDRRAVGAELAAADAAADRGRARLQNAMLDFMQSLSPDQRARIAPALAGRRPWRAERPHRRVKPAPAAVSAPARP